MPVTVTRSLAVPLNSKFVIELGASVKFDTVRVPTPLLPGARMPPAFTDTMPTVPVPASVAPLATVTGPVPVAEPVRLFAASVPAEMVVAPVYVFAPVSVTVPVVVLFKALPVPDRIAVTRPSCKL